ncbi:MAG: DUF455 family protein [Alphaproteobacteria bacterium]|nr:DUF455 family protein [Alphaproteobacteria bacterium]
MSGPSPFDPVVSARAAFLIADANAKAEATLAFAQTVAEAGDLSIVPASDWPSAPGRPELPILLPPNQMPRRSTGGLKGRVSLLHALAHIEFTAINLALDLIGRFAGVPEIGARQVEFVADWARVAGEEARHFRLLETRLNALGACYGTLAAHGGLWEAAERSGHDLATRLAIGPLVLEARGLDVTPGMIARLERDKDADSAKVLQQIYSDEIGHVSLGVKWFKVACAARGHDPSSVFRDAVAAHYRGGLKPPFNHEARRAAGFPTAFLLDGPLSWAG